MTKIGFFKPYKNYVGTIECIDGDYYGKIIDIDDLVTYESDTVENLGREFKLAVDDYISMKIYESQVNEEINEMKRKDKKNEINFNA